MATSARHVTRRRSTTSSSRGTLLSTPSRYRVATPQTATRENSFTTSSSTTCPSVPSRPSFARASACWPCCHRPLLAYHRGTLRVHVQTHGASSLVRHASPLQEERPMLVPRDPLRVRHLGCLPPVKHASGGGCTWVQVQCLGEVARYSVYICGRQW
jgi:hypothetical protein